MGSLQSKLYKKNPYGPGMPRIFGIQHDSTSNDDLKLRPLRGGQVWLMAAPSSASASVGADAHLIDPHGIPDKAVELQGRGFRDRL